MTKPPLLQQTTAPDAWDEWKAELLTIAAADGCPLAYFDPDAFRDYFDDDYSPRDAYDEDQQHAL